MQLCYCAETIYNDNVDIMPKKKIIQILEKLLTKIKMYVII